MEKLQYDVVWYDKEEKLLCKEKTTMAFWDTEVNSVKYAQRLIISENWFSIDVPCYAKILTNIFICAAFGIIPLKLVCIYFVASVVAEDPGTNLLADPYSCFVLYIINPPRMR